MKGIKVQDLNKKSDERGWLIEMLGDELHEEKKSFGQIHVSVAYPGKVRGNPKAVTHEHGNAFLLTAGIMNLLLILDAWDIAFGRKS